MPKSKRDKKISLTKTDKKGLALKQQIIEDVKRCVEKYKSVYVFSVHNMRNELMKDLRQEWKPSRFFFGRNRVIAVGLGRSPAEEIEENLHELAACLKGQCGLLFTDKPKPEVIEWFSKYAVDDFARSGCSAPDTITLPQGPLEQFSHAMEPYLRQIGLPTALERGVITLLRDHEICKKDQILTPEQAKILKLFEHKLSAFRLVLKGGWVKGEGYEQLGEKNVDSGEEQMEDD